LISDLESAKRRIVENNRRGSTLGFDHAPPGWLDIKQIE
jgi:hypothetical protein